MANVYTRHRRSVYVALSTFCDADDAPRRRMMEAGFDVRENRTGRRLKHDEILAELQEADAVIAGVESYDAHILAQLAQLRCISRCGVGVDSIDMDAARRLDIAVLTTPDEVVEPVAQITVGLIFALARNFPQYISAFHQDLWLRYPGFLLSEWTIGLVGFGRIGRAVARYLEPFSPRILATDPSAVDPDASAHVRFVDLPVLLAESDLVSLHAMRAQAAGALIGREQFALMKRGSRLVNTSRGYLVDEDALLDSLKSGHLSGAAIDVFQEEPYTGPLCKLPQVLCTPHVGSFSNASRQAMEMRAAQNVIDFFEAR